LKNSIIKKFIDDHRGKELAKQEGNISSLAWCNACYALYSPLMKKYYQGDCGSLLMIFGIRRGIGFLDFNNYKESTRQTLDKYFYSKKSFTELVDYKKLDFRANHIFDLYNPDKIKNLSNKNLWLLIIKIFKLIQNWQVITLFCEALNEDIIKEYIAKLKLKINVGEFIKISLLIDYKSFIQNQHENLFRTSMVKPIDYRFQWIHASYLYAPAIREVAKLSQQMLHQLGGLRKLEQEINKIRKETARNALVVKKYQHKISGKTQSLFNFIRSAVYLRDTRKVACYKLITVLSNTAREIFRRNKLNKNYIIYSIYEDFAKKTFQQNGYPEELKRRKKGFAIYFSKSGSIIEHVQYETAKQEVYHVMFDTEPGQKEISGNVANRGIAKGTVKIVLSKKDFPKMKQGNILVTSMTRPEFVPLIKKSAAIVTDEGGVTCHAAIISRELNKPCIVGTKRATNFFHDGDHVEVDADNGVVRLRK
jgi:phosphohistidine swiveling domain-containing protein